jgi:hypothetical protein
MYKNTLALNQHLFLRREITNLVGSHFPIILLPCRGSIVTPWKGATAILQIKAKLIKESRVIDSFATTALNLNFLYLPFTH